MLKKSFSKPIVILGGVILALILFVPSLYFYNKYVNLKKSLAGQSVTLKNEDKDLVAKVGKLIELPNDEEPTIATVSDKDKLSPQQFFAKAKNGDKVLIYKKAKKAILYRPSNNKIIEVGPVSISELSPTVTPLAGAINSQTTTATESSSVNPTKSSLVKIAIYNASKTVGLAASTEARLKAQFNNILVVQKSNSQGDYDKTLIAEVKGGVRGLASDIALFLDGEVGSLPTSESKPDADILIIVTN